MEYHTLKLRIYVPKDPKTSFDGGYLRVNFALKSLRRNTSLVFNSSLIFVQNIQVLQWSLLGSKVSNIDWLFILYDAVNIGIDEYSKYKIEANFA